MESSSAVPAAMAEEGAPNAGKRRTRAATTLFHAKDVVTTEISRVGIRAWQMCLTVARQRRIFTGLSPSCGRLRQPAPRKHFNCRGILRDCEQAGKIEEGLGDHRKARRMDLGLTQRAVAARRGADQDSIRNWEIGRIALEVRYYPAVIAQSA